MSHTDQRERMAAGYAVLATCWRQPTAELVDAINDGDIPFAASLQEVTADALGAEHARLFVGPAGPPCPPYESVYRDGSDGDHGQVLGPSTRAVVKWYESYGLGLDPDWPDLPDHVATELEFLAHLTATGERDAREQFLDEHPRQWLPAFLDDVREETSEPFYERLADATATVTKQ